jgi:hypothetical protein
MREDAFRASGSHPFGSGPQSGLLQSGRGILSPTDKAEVKLRGAALPGQSPWPLNTRRGEFRCVGVRGFLLLGPGRRW